MSKRSGTLAEDPFSGPRPTSRERLTELSRDASHHDDSGPRDVRDQRLAEQQRLPWFVRAVVNPAVNPLTVRLVALVEDLPPIPGQQTVGSDDYGRIRDAFMQRGWEGFEQEFDRIVCPDRSDYADIKRDLLREPIFNTRVHRRMTEMFTGKKTAAEMFAEILRESEGKPQ